MGDFYDSAISRFGLPYTGADPDEFFPQVQMGNPYESISVAMPPQKKDLSMGIEARYKRYKETGSEYPVERGAGGNTGGELDEEDWAQINATANPAKTLQMVNDLRHQTDYTRGVQEIGSLDWSDPQKAMRDMQAVFSKRPAAAQQLQQYGAGVYRMLGAEPKQKVDQKELASLRQQIYELDPADKDYRAKSRAFLKANPKAYEDEHLMRVISGYDDDHRTWKNREETTERKGQPVPPNATQLKMYEKAQEALRKAMSAQFTDDQKRDAYKAKYGRDLDKSNEADWNKGWHAAADKKIATAQEDLANLEELFGPKVILPKREAPVSSPVKSVAPVTKSGNTWKVVPRSN